MSSLNAEIQKARDALSKLEKNLVAFYRFTSHPDLPEDLNSGTLDIYNILRSITDAYYDMAEGDDLRGFISQGFREAEDQLQAIEEELGRRRPEIIKELDVLPYQDQTRRLLRWCNDHFEAGRFDEVAKVLDAIDPDDTHPQTLVSFLSTTYPASKQLGEARTRYAKKIYPALSQAMTSEVVDRIYGRLASEVRVPIPSVEIQPV